MCNSLKVYAPFALPNDQINGMTIHSMRRQSMNIVWKYIIKSFNNLLLFEGFHLFVLHLLLTLMNMHLR